MSERFALTDIGFVKRIIIGNDNPEKPADEEHIARQTRLLNKCLREYPRGKIIGVEKNFYILNIGEHQVVMQYIVYHVGFKRKPDWIKSS